MTVIVTGGAGFIGSHLVDALLADGREVVVIDDLSAGSAANVAAGATLEQVDVADRAAVDRIFAAVRPEAVFHLAAQASVTASVADPGRDCRVNVEGTLNVVAAAQRDDAPLVFASTGGALYGDDAPLPTPEDSATRPIAPYGISKLGGEAYVRGWADAHGARNAICRLGNVYGPRQSPHGEAGVVAIFSHRIWAGEGVVLYGHGTPERDYVHVDDVVRGLLAASGTTGTYNVATGVGTSVATLLDLLQAAAGREVAIELKGLRPGELTRSRLDASALSAATGWTPGVALADGLASTYASMVASFEAA